MKFKSLRVSFLVITVVLTKNLAFGCCPRACPPSVGWDCITQGACTTPSTRKTLDVTQDETGGFLNLGLTFGSFIRKLSSILSPGIHSVLTC